MKEDTRPTKTEDGYTIIYSHDQIPDFNDEAKESAFWDTHTWSEELMQAAEPDPKLENLRRSH